MFHEEALTHTPVDEEVFGKEGGNNHTAPVVHPASGEELAHGGVDDGIAGTASTPGLKVGGRVGPGYVGIFWFERLVHAIELASGRKK